MNPRRSHKQIEARAQVVPKVCVKSVEVRYPDISLSDYYTIAEYSRRKHEFDADAQIRVNGIEVR